VRGHSANLAHSHRLPRISQRSARGERGRAGGAIARDRGEAVWMLHGPQKGSKSRIMITRELSRFSSRKRVMSTSRWKLTKSSPTRIMPSRDAKYKKKNRRFLIHLNAFLLNEKTGRKGGRGSETSNGISNRGRAVGSSIARASVGDNLNQKQDGYSRHSVYAPTLKGKRRVNQQGAYNKVKIAARGTNRHKTPNTPQNTKKNKN